MEIHYRDEKMKGLDELRGFALFSTGAPAGQNHKNEKEFTGLWKAR